MNGLLYMHFFLQSMLVFLQHAHMHVPHKNILRIFPLLKKDILFEFLGQKRMVEDMHI